MEKRMYSKRELAQLYCPNHTPANARKTLYRWIHKVPGLMDQLYAIGYNPSRNSFLRREVELIVYHLGEP